MVSDWKWSWPGSMTWKSTRLKYLVAKPWICSSVRKEKNRAGSCRSSLAGPSWPLPP